MHRLVVFVLAWTLVQTAGSRPAVAQEATAAAVACAVAPRTVAGVRAVVGRELTSEPIPDPIPYAPPVGTPTGRGTVQRLHATLLELTACVNAGDTLRFYALVSDAFLRRHAEAIGLPGGEPEPSPAPPAEPLSLAEVRDVTLLSDGRVAALVRFAQGERRSPELLSLLTFVAQDGRLLIDAWQPVTLGASPATAWEPVAGSSYEGVIVPSVEAAAFVFDLTGTEVQGTWTPTAAEIAALEAALEAAIRNAPRAAPDLADRLPGYKRQYAGFVADGRALILVNAFCGDDFPDWRSQPVFVMDGGDCFFQAVWEPATDSFVSVSINGEA